jgi:hypothetical protein
MKVSNFGPDFLSKPHPRRKSLIQESWSGHNLGS